MKYKSTFQRLFKQILIKLQDVGSKSVPDCNLLLQKKHHRPAGCSLQHLTPSEYSEAVMLLYD